MCILQPQARINFLLGVKLTYDAAEVLLSH
jgi:hypothetical protein